MRCPPNGGGHQVIENEKEKLVIRRILRNGRRRYDAALKARFVAASLEPVVSVARLALNNGVNANLLRKWIKQAKKRVLNISPWHRRLSRLWPQNAACRRR